MSQEQVNKQDVENFSAFLATIRHFMAEQSISEVITNPLMPKIVPDRGVDPVKVQFGVGELFLHTSPEWEMKKLLAKGAGSIYQMVSVFRDDLAQNWHKPAFMMLEWYELGIDEMQLIAQCTNLFKRVGIKEQPVIYTCQELYLQHAGFDMNQVGIEDLKNVCETHNVAYEGLQEKEHMSSWLELIWLNLVEPELKGLIIVKDFPVCQSALAKVVQAPYPHAKRFEIYLNGCELANGYHETTDIEALKKRFSEYNGPHPVVNCDEIRNMPDCSGVSIGIDRLYALVNEQGSLYH